MQTWTVALNLLAFLIAALSLPETAALVPAEALPYLAATIAVLNLGLRFAAPPAAAPDQPTDINEGAN